MTTVVNLTDYTTMPIGQYKGQTVSTLPTPFLSWFISQDALRLKYRKTAVAIWTELGRRHQNAQAEAELFPPADGSDLV